MLVSHAGGTRLTDIRRVNFVILGGDTAGEHLLIGCVSSPAVWQRPSILPAGRQLPRSRL